MSRLRPRDLPVSESVAQPEITSLLQAWRAGAEGAEQELMRAVYPVLRDIARTRLRRTRNDFTLQATELANEAYLKISAAKDHAWNDRVHFFAVAARVIRSLVIDYIRAGDSEKRGGDLPFVPLDSVLEEGGEGMIDLRVDWLAVHSALDELETRDAKSARVVELKFFSGLTTDEIAEAMQLSRASVVREWRFARAWLTQRLQA
jgi:RNA polymerase sigma factor (TIGR02999 family)